MTDSTGRVPRFDYEFTCPAGGGTIGAYDQPSVGFLFAALKDCGIVGGVNQAGRTNPCGDS